MNEKQIGKITHFFEKIRVAVINLTDKLNIGDTIHIIGETEDFTQVVTSMQVEHQNIQSSKPGDVVGLKVDQNVREGDKVFLV